MLTVLEEIIEMLSIPEEAAGALMRCFKWNKEKVRCNYIIYNMISYRNPNLPILALPPKKHTHTRLS